MSGEVSIRGAIKPVGGIVAKVEAARQAGVKRVFIPRENYQEMFKNMDGIDVIPVDNLAEVISGSFVREVRPSEGFFQAETLSALPM